MDIDLAPLAVLGDRIEEIARSTLAIMPNIIAALVFFFVFMLVRAGLVYVASRVFKRWKFRPALQNALSSLISVTLFIVGLLIAATIAMPGLTPAGLLTSLGIGSLAIGLAFRDTFENFLAGLLIMMRKPMRIGDFIECGEVEGKVEIITLRDTYVRRTDGVLVLVPNGFLFKNPTRVLTDLDERRNEVIVGVAYGENVDEARAVIDQAVRQLPTVSDQRPVEVFAQAFGASSIDFQVCWWSKSSPLDVRESRDEVVAAIKQGLDHAGIEIPFPYRTLTFKEPLNVLRREIGADDASDQRAA